MTKLLSIGDNHFENEALGYPWAQVVYAPRVSDGSCPACGRELSHFEGPGRAELEGGTCWPDVIGVGSYGPRFIVADQVVEVLRQKSIRGFRAHPILLEYRTGQRPTDKPPRYSYLQPFPGVTLDLSACGLPPEVACQSCGRITGDAQPLRFVPLMETWNGNDIGDFRNFSGYMFCTEAVLSLAHNNRWTNFRFEPLDVLRRHAVRWSGIDYLGDTWPPQWYPDPPSKGRSVEEWLDMTRLTGDRAAQVAVEEGWATAGEVTPEVISNVSEAWAVRAAEALMDFPEEAIPALTGQLNSGGAQEQINAANVLCLLRQECKVRLPEAVLERIRELVPESS